MSAPIGWGILGAGWIAARFAADLRHAPAQRLARVASRDPARARAVAMPHGATTAESYEALVQAEDVDAVYIATPASLHREHCLLALAHGKPVLCEKPFALSAPEAREVVEAARTAGLFCMEAMWTRFLPLYGRIRALLDEEALGPIRQLSAELGLPVEESPATATITAPNLGGGALMDLGVYGLSMAHHLLGPPERVAVEAIRSEGGSIRDVAVLMRHRGGALSSVRASHATSLGNGLEIAGARGRLAVEAPFIQATRARLVPLRAGGRGPGAPTGRAERIKDLVRATPLWPAARALAARARGGGGRTIEAGFRGYGLRFEAEEVARCLAAGRAESALMPLDDTVAVLETADRIRAALEG